MKTVLYARYSSALQNKRSTEDQLRDLRSYCAREGWSVVGEFHDDAISGAAGIDEVARPGLGALLAYVEQGGVDQVVAEATDRIARHPADLWNVFERVKYAGARLFTLSDREVTDMTAAFKGLMDANFRKEMVATIQRGQRGSVSQGRAPADLAYGYRTANRLEPDGRLTRGLRVVEPMEAEMLVRIFTEYAADVSPRMIAKRLNEDGIPGPRGRPWLGNTITGDRKRKNGMLQNRLYNGELIHNRTSKVTDPRTRKQRIRSNPEAEWVIEAVPHLRIVPDNLWQRVQDRRARIAGISYSKQQRPPRLLSGMAACGTCGARWIVIGDERWGCSARRKGLSCTNTRSITTSQFEKRVLAGMKDRMLAPELVKAFVTEYHSEAARRKVDQTKKIEAA